MPKPKIVIVGAGVAGCATAIELAKQNRYEVILLERDHDILKGTSARTPGRMGLGYLLAVSPLWHLQLNQSKNNKPSTVYCLIPAEIMPND